MRKFRTKKEIIKDASKELDEEKESNIQKRYFNWIRENEEQFPVLKTIFHIPNGIHTSNFGMIVHFKQLGLRKGVWDVFIPIYVSGHSGLWIEFKRPTVHKRLTEEQNDFKKLIIEHSTTRPKFIVVDNSNDAILETIKYLYLDIDTGKEGKKYNFPVFNNDSSDK